MRTLMMFASIVVVAAGSFCIANATTAFTSVAFVVGVTLLALGGVELFVIRATVMREGESRGEINAEGLTAVILGAVILANQLTEDLAVTSIFALWMIMDGLRLLSTRSYRLRQNNRNENLMFVLSAVMTLAGVYMLFNKALFNLHVTGMIGATLVLIGLHRFEIAMAIEYRKPEFLTGNQEKLAEAKREEKRAMKKAKDGIRETKEIQRRIAKLNREVAKEASLKEGAERRRSARKN